MKTLGDIGERAAIKHMEKILSKGTHDRGVGDDCAAIDLGREYLLVTTDLVNEKTHIHPRMTPYQIGWFLVAINLSDLAAKGGIPLGLVLSYGLPKTTAEQFLMGLTRGADACAVAFGTTIVGGDTKENPTITLSGTAFGRVKKEEYMARIGAAPGDVIAVTGTLGKAAAGYCALQRQKKPASDLVKGLFEPVPRIFEGRILARSRCVASSMDISDGLSSSLYQLSEINHVGFEIIKQALPLSPELSRVSRRNKALDPYSLALHFGGEYELLVTIPEESFLKVRKTLQRHQASLTPIGIVTRKKEVILMDDAKKRVLENKGYEHFRPHSF